jgi:hypothetical protein
MRELTFVVLRMTNGKPGEVSRLIKVNTKAKCKKP